MIEDLFRYVGIIHSHADAVIIGVIADDKIGKNA
jgi:hypothetical protein